MNIFGMRVIASPYCQRIVSVMQHKKRRNQSAAYHHRVQKKWTKRFGTRVEKVAYVIGGGMGPWAAETLALHPDHMAMLRNMGSNAGIERLRSSPLE